MRSLAVRLAASAAILTSLARAEAPVPSLDLRGFRPPTDPSGFLYLEPTSTPGPGNWNVGAYASYALRPIVLDDAGGKELAKVVAHQASIDYVASIGVGQTWAFGLRVPTVVYQTGDEVRALLPGSTALPHVALGAIALDVKKTLVSPSDLGGFGLSAIGHFYVPTNPRSYVSDRTISGDLRALAELDLLAIAVRGTAGFMMRGAEETFLRNGTSDYRFGNEIPWGLGFTVRPQTFGIDRGGHWRWTAEVHGAIGLEPKFAAGPQSPVLAGLSARYTAGEVSALFGVEAPLNDAIGSPLVRPVVALGWAPRFLDADNDGIEDEADECPELEEDRDGFEDRDGCPDFDNDDDGVSDEDDKCPKEKEDADEFQDDDGCADPDNDGDGVLDAADACPNEKGPANGKKPGCLDPDPDGDGVLRDKDQCNEQPEDKDGFQDDDGCPDPDNDGDGVLDAADVCPTEKGEANAAKELNGCPNADHDGDTFDDAADKCPEAGEDFDGVDDTDGCPEEKAGTPPLTITEQGGGAFVRFRVAPRLAKDDVDPNSLPALRALGATLNAHPDWIVAIGVRPIGTTAQAEQAALNHALTIALTTRWLTHRDSVAEAVGWGAVKDLPGATATGIGILVLSPSAPPKALP